MWCTFPVRQGVPELSKRAKRHRRRKDIQKDILAIQFTEKFGEFIN